MWCFTMPLLSPLLATDMVYQFWAWSILKRFCKFVFKFHSIFLFFFFWHTRHIFTSLGGPERLNTKLKFVKVNENSPPSKPGSGTAGRRWWPPLHSINVLTVVFIDKIKHSYLVYIPCLFGYSFWLHIFVVLFRSYNYRVSQKSPIHRGN